MNLEELKRLAGVNEYKGLMPYEVPVDEGSNISITGTEKRKLERKHKIQQGTPEWFQLWFSKPYLTGEKPVGK